jgi:hypothetical protein
MFATRTFIIVFESIMGGILILDVDVWIKAFTLLVAIIVGWYSIRANRAKEKLDSIQAEIKQQELYKLMQECKERETKLKKDEEKQLPLVD